MHVVVTFCVEVLVVYNISSSALILLCGIVLAAALCLLGRSLDGRQLLLGG